MLVAGHIITAVQSIVSRNVSPLDTAVVDHARTMLDCEVLATCTLSCPIRRVRLVSIERLAATEIVRAVRSMVMAGASCAAAGPVLAWMARSGIESLVLRGLASQVQGLR